MTEPIPDEAVAEAVSAGHARLPNGNLLMGMPVDVDDCPREQDGTTGPQPAPELPKVLGNPQDAAEGWLAVVYEPDDSSVGTGYERSDMIDAYHAGWDEARELIARFGRDENGRWRALEPQPAPELAELQAAHAGLRKLAEDGNLEARDMLAAIAEAGQSS